MLEFAKLPEVHVNSFEPKAVEEYLKKLHDISYDFGPEQEIMIRIDSFGGSIYGLAKLSATLKRMPNPIITYTESMAMSAGAILLSTCGDLRVAHPEASIMIHEIQAGAFGDIKDIRNTTDFLNKENDKWMTILAVSMGLKSAKDIRKLLGSRSESHELYLTAHEAKRLKLIDRIGSMSLKAQTTFKYVIG